MTLEASIEMLIKDGIVFLEVESNNAKLKSIESNNYEVKIGIDVLLPKRCRTCKYYFENARKIYEEMRKETGIRYLHRVEEWNESDPCIAFPSDALSKDCLKFDEYKK
jgi:hypothetical protein